ncbi:MAG: GNAT family N-acetyltransferase [Nevskia sp.]|nr:GNAT family N-acetyltransferase [Nevskia sp.]
MNAIVYRFATPDDAPLLARLNAQLVEEGADFGPADPEYLEQRMRRWLKNGQDHAVLFESPRGEVLAYAVYKEYAKEIYLRQFLVLQAARRHGVGRRAFDLLRSEIWCREKRLTLEVLSTNQAGYRFWRSLGYRDCAMTLEIPAPAAKPAAQVLDAAPRLDRRAPPGLLAALRARLRVAAALPAKARPALGARSRQVGHAISRAAASLALLCFVPTEVSAAPVQSPAAHAAPAGVERLTDAELHALRASGGRCTASIYRTAWSVAKAYGMEPAWIVAVIETESSCRPDAVSVAGAQGLMQLVPATGARDAYRLAYGKDEPPSAALLRDPQANIRLGVAYLHGLHRHFLNIGSAQARLLLAVASYNCGAYWFDEQLPTASAGWSGTETASWIAAHAPLQTRGYVTQVSSTALRYSSAISAAHVVPAVLTNAAVAQ